MSAFSQFSKLIHARFEELSKHELFVTAAGDDVWAAYLAAFPAGTNEIYRERTEHDCSCCRNFIRNLGNVAAIVDGRVVSVWGGVVAEYPYNVVQARLNTLVVESAISGVFRTKERQYGAEKTFEQRDDGVHTWHHFHGRVAPKHFSATPAEARGEINTTFAVFQRGVAEISVEAIDTVLDLIASKALYRGEEFEKQVQQFRPFVSKPALHLWANIESRVARLKNTVIGTLLVDITSGVDIETAVKSFEQKVAPTNYKRPTALITKGMVDQALKTIAELDLEGALKRRFAKIGDISVNNVLWVDNSVKGKMRDGVAGLLMGEVAGKAGDAKAQAITIDDFMNEIVPRATGMELFIKNTQQSNFVSLTAPEVADSGRLFKWSNDFGWSYDGNITDSIKEKVKRAGGNVTNAKLRVSLAWYNHDDLDIHCVTPSGDHIYYFNKCGVLDVDMNAGRGTTREPVENLSWGTLQDGVYQIHVNQYSRRETTNVGFELEVENAGAAHQYTYRNAVTGTVRALSLTIKNGLIADIKTGPDLVGGGFSTEKWGVKTEQFVKVNTLMKSPNHWDGNSVGNKHWFFILKDCANPEPTRGIYNEFLNSNLEKHRKVFEVLGNKTKCPVVDEQLSGVGFSSTRQDEVLVRVASAASSRLYNVKF